MVVLRCFFISGGDSALVFEPADDALNDVAPSVHRIIKCSGPPSVALGGHHQYCTTGTGCFLHSHRIISPVRHNGSGRQPFYQLWPVRTVSPVPGTDHQAQQPGTDTADGQMHFGTQSTPASSKGLGAFFLAAPLAWRCDLTVVESIWSSAVVLGLKAAKSRSQTPALA